MGGGMLSVDNEVGGGGGAPIFFYTMACHSNFIVRLKLLPPMDPAMFNLTCSSCFCFWLGPTPFSACRACCMTNRALDSRFLSQLSSSSSTVSMAMLAKSLCLRSKKYDTLYFMRKSLSNCLLHIVSWETEGRYHYSKMFRWKPEGRCHHQGCEGSDFNLISDCFALHKTPFSDFQCVEKHIFSGISDYFRLFLTDTLTPRNHRLCTAIAPFWFSMKHLWILVVPFWLLTDDMFTFESIECGLILVWHAISIDPIPRFLQDPSQWNYMYMQYTRQILKFTLKMALLKHYNIEQYI